MYCPRPEGGSIFCITLNLEKALQVVEADVEQQDQRHVQDLLAQRRDLLVEDDRALRKLTKAQLERDYNVEVVTAADGLEALDVIKSQAFDLILTDFFMPRLDGRELILRLRSEGRQIPIIAVMAASVGDETERLLNAGAVVYKLMTPVRLIEAVVKIEEAGALAGWSEGRVVTDIAAR